jgi:hypothetical protein
MPSAELAALLDLPKMPTKAGQRVLEAIVADAIVSARLYPDRRVSYSRRAQHWADRARYAGLGFNRTNVTLAVDKLVEKGILIDHDRRPAGQRGIQSSYVPSPSLAALAMPALRTEKGETVILKDSEGNMIGYEDTPETREKRYTIARINRVLESANIHIDRERIVDEGRWTRIDNYLVFPDHKSLRRIFNGDWTRGGRFYGAFWQNMRSRDRRHLTIDGHRTAEVDYDQLHARMIYARANKRLQGDAYEIEGWNRKIAKRAFFIVINAKTFLEAKGAVANLLVEKGLDPKMSASLIESMKARHHEVRKFFHSGCGLKLQNLDAQMAEYVLKVMVLKKGIPCLPIHDSFIVPATATPLLMRVMREAYERFVGEASGTVCTIKYSPGDEVMKSGIYAPQVHTVGKDLASASRPSASATYSSPPVATSAPSTSIVAPALCLAVSLESIFPSWELSTSSNQVPTSGAPTSSSESQVRDRPVISQPKMPTFLRRAQEESARAWREEQERKRARAESYQRARQKELGGQDGTSGMPDREQSVPRPEAGRYADVPTAVLNPL